MPLYEYICRDCDTIFEARRPMADADEPVACPAGHDRSSVGGGQRNGGAVRGRLRLPSGLTPRGLPPGLDGP